MRLNYFKLLLGLFLPVFSTVLTAANQRIVRAHEICFYEQNGCLVASETNFGRVNIELGPGLADKLSPIYETVRSVQDKYLSYNFYESAADYERAKTRMEEALGGPLGPAVWLSKSEVDRLKQELALDREVININIDICGIAVAGCGLLSWSSLMTSGATLPVTILECGASFLQCKSTYVQWKQYQLKLQNYLDNANPGGGASSTTGGAGEGPSGSGGPSGNPSGDSPAAGGTSAADSGTVPCPSCKITGSGGTVRPRPRIPVTT